MSNVLTNGAMVSTFKRTDSHTVRGRPTRKDGVVIYDYCVVVANIKTRTCAV